MASSPPDAIELDPPPASGGRSGSGPPAPSSSFLSKKTCKTKTGNGDSKLMTNNGVQTAMEIQTLEKLSQICALAIKKYKIHACLQSTHRTLKGTRGSSVFLMQQRAVDVFIARHLPPRPREIPHQGNSGNSFPPPPRTAQNTPCARQYLQPE